MAATTANLLDLLELLQSRPIVTGREVADRLGIDRRTVRRYMTTLQAIGIPVDGARGVGGGYRLRPGYRLPPLMLGDEEAVVVILGLLAVERLGIGDRDTTRGALEKVQRVLPEGLRRRTEPLGAAIAFSTPAAGSEPAAAQKLLLLTEAIARRRRVRMAYETPRGEVTEREVSPHAVVVHSGRWYLVGDDHLRSAQRTFRIDRIGTLSLGKRAASRPCPELDPAAVVRSALARVARPWQVEVLLDLPADDARRRVSPSFAELEPCGERAVLRMQADSLDWAASVIAGLGCTFAVRAPDELRDSIGRLAARLVASTERACTA